MLNSLTFERYASGFLQATFYLRARPLYSQQQQQQPLYSQQQQQQQQPLYSLFICY